MTDEEFLKKLAEDVRVETYSPGTHDWVPQEECYVTSGKPLDLSAIRKDNNDTRG